MHKRVLALALALCLTLALFGCGAAPAAESQPETAALEKYTATWFDVFDTVTTVLGYAESEEAWNRQMDALHADLTAYHQLYDIYHSYEGLVNLRDVNLTAAQAPVEVDARIFAMLAEAKELCRITNGQMNIAQGQLYSLWHEKRDQAEQDPQKAALPDPDALTKAAAHGSIDDLVLDENASTVFFADPQMRIDVGSVGKGYAVEMAAQAAQQRGLSSALISVGGNLRSIGTKPDGTKWTGGAQNPWQGMAGMPEDAYLRVVELEDMALVTSGDYQRFFTVEGKRYHHLIDPDTLYPAGFYSAVCVLGPDSGLADCLSTGLFCMEFDEGLALVEGMEAVEAMWMFPDGSLKFSSGFESHCKSTN